MNSRIIFSAIFIFLSTQLLTGQSTEILAESAMLNAEEAYSNENYDESLKYLEEAEKILGKTYSRIQYLKVKSWMAVGNRSQNDLTAWKKAEAELKKYFEVATEGKASPEKYDEMVLSVSKIKNKIQEIEKRQDENWRKVVQVVEIEKQLYNEAKEKNTIHDYLNYINKYPKGIYIKKAYENAFILLAPLWMKKNLDVDQFSNGEKISKRFGDKSSAKLPAYTFYDAKDSNNEIFGKLYNYYAVADPRGLCPTGWHVSTYQEWTILIEGLGGIEAAGNKLKEKGALHWKGYNKGSDEIGFSALPGGEFDFYKGFFLYNFKGEIGSWWCSDKHLVSIRNIGPYNLLLYYPNDVGVLINLSSGYSVRCVKNY
jgi:uncharacterized protein (TIGR02145 family)